MTSAALLAAANRVLGIALPDGSRRDLNEANTRAFVIDPIIAALGYAGPDQIELEVPVGRSGQSLDYVLTAYDIRIAVEAKSLQTALADREASQLVGYIAQEGIRWAVLTNGRDWHIFDNEVSGKWEDKRVATIDLEAAHRGGRLEDVLRPLAFFAREALASGDAELSDWSRDERARAHLDKLLTNSGSPVIQAAIDAMRKQGITLSPQEVVDLLRARGAAPAPAAQPTPSSASLSPPQLASAVASTTSLSHEQGDAGERGTRRFFLFPALKHGGATALDHLKAWLPTGAWRVRRNTPDRLVPQPGDQCCFWATYVGVVATAEIAGPADQEVARADWPGPTDWHPGNYRVPLRNISWLPEPVWIPPTRRGELDALQTEHAGQRRPGLVPRAVLPLSERDFDLLTGRVEPPYRTVRDAPSAPPVGPGFYLIPAGFHDGLPGFEYLRAWLPTGAWGLRVAARYRLTMKDGDQCCFYATGVGIVATARITGPAEQEVPQEGWPGPNAWNPNIYALPIRDLQWLPQPIPITLALRSRLDAFENKQPDGKWGWLVQTTSRLTEHDFNLLTGRS
ncbi:MAG: type I restriction enzyme HsdR N-terminal domain-containing protein [Chloroflexota bacterium]|nr:type I restriction enzyme HsdR N-terminal domain-containing protein [Chloroflexota bacterium]